MGCACALNCPRVEVAGRRQNHTNVSAAQISRVKFGAVSNFATCRRSASLLNQPLRQCYHRRLSLNRLRSHPIAGGSMQGHQ